MKKILIILILLTVTLATTFAQGLTQYDLAELLINKAKAENIIENKDYSEDEIIAMVIEYQLFKFTDSESEVTAEEVRASFSMYDLFKKTQSIVVVEEVRESEVTTPVVIEETYKSKFKKIEPLTVERLKEIDKRSWDYEEYLNLISHNEDWTATGYDYFNYPKIAEYQMEMIKIVSAYALEYDLYMVQSGGGVELHKGAMERYKQNAPFFQYMFFNTPTNGYQDGKAYTLLIELSSLHNVLSKREDKLLDYRKRIEDANFETDYVVNAFVESLKPLFPKDKERDAIAESMIKDYHYNLDKEYSYADYDYITVADYTFLRSFSNSKVWYELDYDFTK